MGVGLWTVYNGSQRTLYSPDGGKTYYLDMMYTQKADPALIGKEANGGLYGLVWLWAIGALLKALWHNLG